MATKNAKSSKKNSRRNGSSKNGKIVAKGSSVARVLKGDGREGSISFAARKLIKSGKTNEQVFATLVKQFGTKKVPQSHRSYPSWYRRQLVVAKQVNPKFAEQHAH